MFNNTKYTKWYFNIIDAARSRATVNGPTEEHHIVPGCLGGPSTADNLVRLTPREHCIVHTLLPSMLDDPGMKRKMAHAMRMMTAISPDTPGRITAKTYQLQRIDNLVRLTNLPDSIRKKMSEGVKRAHQNDPTLRVRMSESIRKVKGSDEARAKASARNVIRYQDPEERQKLSQSVVATWSDPALREQQSRIVKAARSTTQSKAKTSAQARAQWADPEHRKKCADSIARWYADPSNDAKRAAKSEKLRKSWEARKAAKSKV